MGTKLTTKEFITKALGVHGSTYDYSKVKYTRNTDKVIIVCKEHGDFTQSPANHLKHTGCPTCAITKRANSKRGTTDKFIVKARRVHGDTYDYTNTKYKGSQTNVEIICKTHGSFLQTPSNHLHPYGCLQCGFDISSTSVRSNTEEFVVKAKKLHGDVYDYSMVKYVTARDKVEIICKTHGSFLQTPSNHLHPYGCQQCASDSSNFKRYYQKQTTLYVVDFGIYNNTHIIKIGLTKASVTKRFYKARVKPKIVYERQFSNGLDALLLEQSLLENTLAYKVPLEVYNNLLYNNGGYTELRNHRALNIIKRYGNLPEDTPIEQN